MFNEAKDFAVLKKLLKPLMPPVLVSGYRYFRDYKKTEYLSSPDTLFDGDDSLFKELIAEAHIYGEYGCGKSTKWVLNNAACKVISVDTSSEWIDAVRRSVSGGVERLNIYHADLGEVTSWGRPKSYEKIKSFRDYTDYVWTQVKKPDVVLVDGRFRVSCFLTSLKFSEQGTKIIFDDYTDRPHYHFVEKYLSRTRECGRQCLFIVPPKNQIDSDELDRDILAFRNVMD